MTMAMVFLKTCIHAEDVTFPVIFLNIAKMVAGPGLEPATSAKGPSAL